MDVPVTGLEVKATTGWICPRCQSVHAPFISTCPTCDASRFPRVQAWLLRDLNKKLDDRTLSTFNISRQDLEKLVHAAEAKS